MSFKMIDEEFKCENCGKKVKKCIPCGSGKKYKNCCGRKQ